jgi:glycosyltransferase involved in cell wall biosynthesis
MHTGPSTVTEPGVDPADERAEPLVSVVMPCLNEADSVGTCVQRAMVAMAQSGIAGEVVVVDNGSSDGSPDRAREAGARVVHERRRGYGSAYLAGFAASRGKYLAMGDADLSYDFADVPRLIEPLQAGADVVMGSRLKGVIEPGAMPWLHRWVGNPLLTGVLNLFFRTGASDAHCGMRAFRRDLLPALDLRTTGMEFASEHLIRAAKVGCDIREMPIAYHRRAGESKLSAWADGWRHLRFLLVHSPTWLFVVPGATMVIAGLLAALVVVTEVEILGRRWFLHTLIAAAMFAIVGAQVLTLGLSARTYAAYYLGEHDPLFERLRSRARLEHGLVVGGLLLLAGAVVAGVVVVDWVQRGFGPLAQQRLAVAGLTLIVLGLQTIFGAFFLSILGLRRRAPSEEPQLPGQAERRRLWARQ